MPVILATQEASSRENWKPALANNSGTQYLEKNGSA
jgi:hypothetical protein